MRSGSLRSPDAHKAMTMHAGGPASERESDRGGRREGEEPGQDSTGRSPSQRPRKSFPARARGLLAPTLPPARRKQTYLGRARPRERTGAERRAERMASSRSTWRGREARRGRSGGNAPGGKSGRDRSTQIVTHCESERRSAAAAARIRSSNSSDKYRVTLPIKTPRSSTWNTCNTRDDKRKGTETNRPRWTYGPVGPRMPVASCCTTSTGGQATNQHQLAGDRRQE